ncbi:hypothetical protein BESB_004830 [Besnoitia besnoiti]|uniref:Uncharacterized protein n=1 Tax=Besnoitia besnoiti TaxID=94643 RepID=A0A2A9MQ99_BESBE|nr:hypothetical protein BESB_004830 [Besnoitia besnoiti]PFH38142.1 hypothetical protein BESB_004830 [Besnoitia besnoiti]
MPDGSSGANGPAAAAAGLAPENQGEHAQQPPSSPFLQTHAFQAASWQGSASQQAMPGPQAVQLGLAGAAVAGAPAAQQLSLADLQREGLRQLHELQRRQQLQPQQPGGASPAAAGALQCVAERSAQGLASDVRLHAAGVGVLPGGQPSPTPPQTQFPFQFQAAGGSGGLHLPSRPPPVHPGAATSLRASPLFPHQSYSPVSMSSVSSAEDDARSRGVGAVGGSVPALAPVSAALPPTQPSSGTPVGPTLSGADALASLKPSFAGRQASQSVGPSPGAALTAFASPEAARLSLTASLSTALLQGSARDAPFQPHPYVHTQFPSAGAAPQRVNAQQVAVQQLLERIRLQGESLHGLGKLLMGTLGPGGVPPGTAASGRPAPLAGGVAGASAAPVQQPEQDLSSILAASRSAAGLRDAAMHVPGAASGAEASAQLAMQLQHPRVGAAAQSLLNPAGAGGVPEASVSTLPALRVALPAPAGATSGSAAAGSPSASLEPRSDFSGVQGLSGGTPGAVAETAAYRVSGSASAKSLAARSRFLRPPVIIPSRATGKTRDKFLQKSQSVAGGFAREAGGGRRGLIHPAGAIADAAGAGSLSAQVPQIAGRFPRPGCSGQVTQEGDGRLSASFESLKQLQRSVNHELLLRHQEQVQRESGLRGGVSTAAEGEVEASTKRRNFMVWPPGIAGALTATRRVRLYQRKLSPAYLPSDVDPASVKRLLDCDPACSPSAEGCAGSTVVAQTGEDARCASQSRSGSSEKEGNLASSGLNRDKSETGDATEVRYSGGNSRQVDSPHPPWYAFLEDMTVSGFLAYWYTRQHIAARLYKQLNQMDEVERRLQAQMSGACDLHTNLFFFSMFPEEFSNQHFRRNLGYFPQYAVASNLAAAAGLKPLSQYGDSSEAAIVAATKERGTFQIPSNQATGSEGSEEPVGNTDVQKPELLLDESSCNQTSPTSSAADLASLAAGGEHASGENTRTKEARAGASANGVPPESSAALIIAAGGVRGQRTSPWVAEARYLPSMPSLGGAQLAEDQLEVEHLIQAAQALLQEIGAVEERQLASGKGSRRLEREEEVPLLVAALPRAFEAALSEQQHEQLTALAARKLLPLEAWRGRDFRSFKAAVPFAARALFAMSVSRLEHLIASFQQRIAASIASLELLRNSLALLQQVEEHAAPHIYAIPQHVLGCIYNRGGQGLDTVVRNPPETGPRCDGRAGQGDHAALEDSRLEAVGGSGNRVEKASQQPACASSAPAAGGDAQTVLTSSQQAEGVKHRESEAAPEETSVAPLGQTASALEGPFRERSVDAGRGLNSEPVAEAEEDVRRKGENEENTVKSCSAVIAPTWERGLRLGPPVSAADFAVYTDAFEDYLPVFADQCAYSVELSQEEPKVKAKKRDCAERHEMSVKKRRRDGNLLADDVRAVGGTKAKTEVSSTLGAARHQNQDYRRKEAARAQGRWRDNDDMKEKSSQHTTSKQQSRGGDTKDRRAENNCQPPSPSSGGSCGVSGVSSGQLGADTNVLEPSSHVQSPSSGAVPGSGV